MILPKGKVVYGNLNTQFIKINGLLKQLAQNSFSGYVHAKFWEWEGALMIDNGRIVSGIWEHDKERLVGKDAINLIKSKLETEDGSIDVVAVSPEKIGLLASTAQGKTLFKGLSTEFVSLRGLVNKLMSDRKDCVIQMAAPTGLTGAIFIKDSQVIEAMYIDETGKLLSGTVDIIGKLSEIFKITGGAVLDVIEAEKTRGISTIGQPEVKERPIIQPKPIQEPSPSMLTPAPPTPKTETEKFDTHELDEFESISEDTLASLAEMFGAKPAVSEPTIKPAEPSVEELVVKPEKKTIIPMPERDITPPETPQVTPEISKVSTLEIIKKANELLGSWAGEVKPEILDMRIAETALEIADKHPYLDPFADEVAFENGQFVLKRKDLTADEIADGVDELLSNVAEKLSLLKNINLKL